MGSCGCGDFQGEFTLPAPNGGLYVFWRYHPCDYCKTPAGIVVSLVKKEDIPLWEANEIPKLKLNSTNPERLIPVFSVESFSKVMGEYLNDFSKEDISSFKDIIEYDVYDLLRDIMYDKSDEEWGNWKP